ncbi:tyrosine-protein phosphatase [Caenibius sp. WL]|nr:tyrosine-protein phosphatase [Caenibius sp. WL]
MSGVVAATPAVASEPCPAVEAKHELGSRFSSAEVVRNDQGYLVRWATTGVTRVAIEAGENPDGRGGGLLGVGGPAGEFLAPLSAEGKRTFFRLTPDCGPAIVIADRNLSRPNLANLRDVGGYRTEDGNWVRMGVALRSSELSHLETADRLALEKLNVTTVVDLRHVDERKTEPDDLPDRVRYVVADVFANTSDEMGDVQSLIETGRANEVLIRLNRMMVSSPSARRAYGDMFRILADDTAGPVLFHCTAGKDRAGWAAAALLTLLGVPRETIYRDYLLSNEYRAADIAANVEKLGTAYVPLQRAEPQYLAAAFDEVEQRYGTFANYLRSGLGLNDEEIAKLKRRFLVNREE